MFSGWVDARFHNLRLSSDSIILRDACSFLRVKRHASAEPAALDSQYLRPDTTCRSSICRAVRGERLWPWHVLACVCRTLLRPTVVYRYSWPAAAAPANLAILFRSQSSQDTIEPDECTRYSPRHTQNLLVTFQVILTPFD